MKCIACGSSALVSGTVHDNASGGNSYFKLHEIPLWKSVFGLGTRKIHAYGCVHCKHMQLAVDFSEKDVDRYRQFEGEQPSILERLNEVPEKLASSNDE